MTLFKTGLHSWDFLRNFPKFSRETRNFGGRYFEKYLWTTERILSVKGLLSGLRQFMAIESPLKMMNNAFYFILKGPFVLEIFTFLSWPFGYEEKHLDKKIMVNLKIFDVRNWTINNYNIHLAQYFQEVKATRPWNLIS